MNLSTPQWRSASKKPDEQPCEPGLEPNRMIDFLVRANPKKK